MHNMEWYSIVITVGSVITASGVIYALINKIVKKASKKIVDTGIGIELNELRTSIDSLAGTVNNIKNELDANTRVTLKLELKSLFKNHPHEIGVINMTMDKYKSLHGDSYIDDLYEEWKEEYELPVIQKKLNIKKKGKK